MEKTGKVIIFGINDLAELAHFYFLSESKNSKEDVVPVAFSVNLEYIKEDTFKGLPVVPFEDLEKYYSPLEYKFTGPVKKEVTSLSLISRAGAPIFLPK